MAEPAERERILDRVQEWIRSADQKAEAMTAVNAIAAGFLLGEVSDWLKSEYTSGCVKAFLLVGCAALAVGISYPVRALFPRIKLQAPRSVTFFGSIAAWDPAEYRERLAAMDDAAWAEDHASQIQVCSEIAVLKLQLLQRGVYWTAAGLGILAASYLAELAGF